MTDVVHRRIEFDFDGAAEMTVNHGQAAEDKIPRAAEECLLWIAHVERADSIAEIAGGRV